MFLEIRDLSTHFETERGVVGAVDGVSLRMEAGQTVAVVGESGCGKTVLALSIMRLLPSPPARIVSGKILLDGKNLLELSEDEMRTVRGRDISMIFQEPMTSLNPVFTVGEQIAEVLRLHQSMKKREAKLRSIEMLRQVGIPYPEKRVDAYPHQLSGGMRQRVMIAIAMACNPRVMLADEPTTALDVTIQAQILDLIASLQQKTGTSVLLITHDLGIVAGFADFVFVMYAGRIVESGPVDDVFRFPGHPYTVGLMNSVPGIRSPVGRDVFLKAIPGVVPELFHLPPGCRFQDRCPEALPICRVEEPKLEEIGRDHGCRCWKRKENGWSGIF
jgi:peptide/nickel transport system ATP-binding protein/oligopeptide transport system ATP-binding protein